MWTLTFWKAAAERAIKTFAQTLAATLTTAAVAGQINEQVGDAHIHVPWEYGLAASGLAGLISLLVSIGSDAVTDKPGPSLVDAEVLAE